MRDTLVDLQRERHKVEKNILDRYRERSVEIGEGTDKEWKRERVMKWSTMKKSKLHTDWRKMLRVSMKDGLRERPNGTSTYLSTKKLQLWFLS